MLYILYIYHFIVLCVCVMNSLDRLCLHSVFSLRAPTQALVSAPWISDCMLCYLISDKAWQGSGSKIQGASSPFHNPLMRPARRGNSGRLCTHTLGDKDSCFLLSLVWFSNESQFRSLKNWRLTWLTEYTSHVAAMLHASHGDQCKNHFSLNLKYGELEKSKQWCIIFQNCS